MGGREPRPMHFRLVAGYEQRAPRLEEIIEAGRMGRLPPQVIREAKWFVFTGVKPEPPMELDFYLQPIPPDKGES